MKSNNIFNMRIFGEEINVYSSVFPEGTLSYTVPKMTKLTFIS